MGRQRARLRFRPSEATTAAAATSGTATSGTATATAAKTTTHPTSSSFSDHRLFLWAAAVKNRDTPCGAEATGSPVAVPAAAAASAAMTAAGGGGGAEGEGDASTNYDATPFLSAP